jgi:parallel beta-helix repeat protein
VNAQIRNFARPSAARRRATMILPLAAAASALFLPGQAAQAAGCTGTQLTPGANVASIINAAPSGRTFCFAPGVYRVTTTIKPQSGVSLIGAPGAVLSGAKPVTGWTRSGAQWVASGQTQGPNLNAGAPGAGLQYPQARYDDNVFQDGAQLWKAGVKVGGQVIGKAASAIGAREYFFDYDADKIYLGSDPTGHTIEAAVAPTLIESARASGVTVAGLTVQMSTDRGVSAMGSGWTVRDNVVRLNATTGVSALDNSKVLNNTIDHNGVYGITGNGANITVDGNDVSFNDNSRLEMTNGKCNNNGGSKWVNTTNLAVTNNNFHDNYCNGIWLDINTYNSLVAGNRSVNNKGHGIVHEISYKATIRNNEVSGNGGWGIVNRDSPDDVISANSLTGNAQGGIILLQSPRSDHPSSYGPHVIKNTDVFGNTVRMAGTGVTFGAVDTAGGKALFSSGNRFHGNTYYLSSLSGRVFRWGGSGLDSQGWKSAGQDGDGKFLLG